MSSKKKLLGAAFAAAAMLLVAGCGASVYYFAKTSISVTANGNINLNAYDNNGQHSFSTIGNDTPRVIPTNSNNKAKIKLNFSFDGGNLNANGSYSDGDVRFNFKGAADLMNAVGYGRSGIKQNPLSQLIPTSNSRPSTSGYTTYKGGACWQFASLYESTNPAMPGTGLVNFVVCDAPSSTSFSTYTGGDYVTVYVGDFQTGELNPFANYYSGGTLSGEESSTSLNVKYPTTEPSATPTPIYPAPSPSNSPS
jgi:hypothetical protein